MANGADSAEYVVLSKVRRGLKREFAFAWKSQSECGGSIGQRRVTRSQRNGSFSNVVPKNVSSKKLKTSGAKERKVEMEKECVADESVNDDAEKVVCLSEEEEPMSDVEDLNNDDEKKNNTGEVVEEPSEGKTEKSSCGADMPEEPKDGVLEPISEDLPKAEDHVKQEPSDVEVIGTEPVYAEKVGEDSMVHIPTRRITRSSLKSNAVLSEVSRTNDVKAEEESNGIGISPLLTPENNKLEMKMSKKVALKKFPAKLRELLDTGLLEGLPVRYIRSSKVREQPDTALEGVIKGSGILCFCYKCNGAEVLTPNQFELHAGSSNKRPPEYIYLENGKNLRDVLNACRDAPSEAFEMAVKMAIGCLSENRPTFCQNCKGSLPEDTDKRPMLLCNACLALKEPQPISAQRTDISDRSLMSVSITKSSDRVSHGSSSRSKSQGRITRKDVRMHRLVFEELDDGTALAYYARGEKLLEGYKKGFGIFCFCCNQEVSPSQFEAHAGWASRRKPYLNIYTSNGVSLHELSISLSKERKFSAEENDDLCSICADGGDLLCCDTCPRAFHQVCVSLPSIPQGTWYCKYCQNTFQKEKFVEHNANAVAAGRVKGIDPIEQITRRCIRIVETFEAEVGGCALCRRHDFSRSGFGPHTVIICDQCEKEYHVGCLKEHNMDDLKELPKGKWFCCTDCNMIHSALQKLVADGEEKLPDSLMNIITNKLKEKGSEGSINLDIRWRLLRGKMVSDETRVLLSNSVAIFHDRFDPIADASTSRLDLIPHMVYGRNLRDQDFGGMYCAVLMFNSCVVSAGVFRIFGKEFAELPLVATSTDSEGQGYFQTLFSCIENLLESLGVRTLVLPAADEAESLWKNKFGFEKMLDSQVEEYKRHYQLLVFQGTSMLQKPITKS